MSSNGCLSVHVGPVMTWPPCFSPEGNSDRLQPMPRPRSVSRNVVGKESNGNELPYKKAKKSTKYWKIEMTVQFRITEVKSIIKPEVR